MQLAQEQGMIIYSSLLPKNLLKQLLQNWERRLILVQLLIAECFPRLPISAAMKCAFPKWVTYSREAFGSLLQQYCCCQWFKWTANMSAFGRPLCEGGIIEQQPAQKQEVKWNWSSLRVCTSISLPRIFSESWNCCFKYISFDLLLKGWEVAWWSGGSHQTEGCGMADYTATLDNMFFVSSCYVELHGEGWVSQGGS